MITHLAVQNFKCLQDTSVELGPFTVLIGANDSGKSSLLDAIHVLGRTVREPLDTSLRSEEGVGANPFDELVWRRDVDRKMSWTIRGSSGGTEFTYELQLARGPNLEAEELLTAGSSLVGTNADYRGGYWTGSKAEIGYLAKNNTAFCSALVNPPQSLRANVSLLEAIAAGFASTAKYRFDPRSLRKVAPPETTPVLSPSGDNLAAALDALLTGPDRTAIQSLESALHDAVPTLSGIALRTVLTGSNGSSNIGKAVEFTLSGTRPPVTIPAANASEGALLLTAFLALAYGATPEILLIEEPENGLHPSRLAMVIDLLRKISTGSVGNRPRQVIMTTHSPLLLNYIQPEEVRILRRDPERGTEVTPMTAVPNLERLLGEFTVGELWYLLTEEGLLRGEQP
jgi:predicted ATPase